eukprot:NODE_2885_length_1097_cov_14.839695_g2646_i0.p1 GENE.NODE_2885_length_1097_cov_14.839695_g2646_i0~~NODE_2885_length_1097_cov_14.839695_g2646_i0.p1  ORF type:complete len:113 (+),score=9.03 NODE_2885_length_1097_cov_14.839695_g2646_i0:458-796(+)
MSQSQTFAPFDLCLLRSSLRGKNFPFLRIPGGWKLRSELTFPLEIRPQHAFKGLHFKHHKINGQDLIAQMNVMCDASFAPDDLVGANLHCCSSPCVVTKSKEFCDKLLEQKK